MRFFYCLLAVSLAATTSLFAQWSPSIFFASSNGPACEGQSFQISTSFPPPPAGTSLSFRWSGPNGFTSTSYGSITVPASAATAGVYSVTMTFSGTNQGTATASATASLGVPALSPRIYDGKNYNSSVQICGPTSVSLSATDPYITTNSDGVAYHWTGPNNFVSNEQNPVVQQATPGEYVLEATYPNNCGAARASVWVENIAVYTSLYSVGPNPKPTSSFCPGESIEIRTSAYPPAGTTTTYRWSGPNGFTSTAQNITLANLTAATAGIYSVTATFSGACSATAVSSRTIKVGLPSIYLDGNSYVCPGGQASLSASIYDIDNSSTSVSYQWSGPNGFTSSSQSLTLTNVTSSIAGLYSVTATLTGNCNGTVSTSTQVNVRDLSVGIFSNDRYCPGTSFKLNLSFSANVSSNRSTLTYRWIGPNGFASSEMQPTVPTASTLSSGTYSLTVTVAGECSGTYTATQKISIDKPTNYVGSYPITGVAQSQSLDSDIYCSGSTISLSTSNRPYDAPVASYRWRGPNGFTSTNEYITLSNLSPAMSGVYSLTTIYTGNCASTRVNFTNIVVGNPTVSIGVFGFGGTTPLCPGNDYRLVPYATMGQDTLPPAISSYEWTLPDGTTSNATSLTVTKASQANAGRYILKTTLGGFCATSVSRDTANIVLGITPPKIRASNPFIANGQSATLYAEKCEGTTVQWSDGQKGLSIVVKPNQTTTYTAACKGYEGCFSEASAPLTIRVSDQPEADLSLRLSTSNRAPALGQPVTVTVSISNNSKQEARNVLIESRLPSLLTVINAGNLQLDGSILKTTLASIPASSTVNVTFQVALTGIGVARLSAQIMATDNPDPDSWPASGTNDGQDDVSWLDLRTNTPGALVSLSPEPNPAYLPDPGDENGVLSNDLVDLSLGLSVSNSTPVLNDIITVTLLIDNYDNRSLLSPEATTQLPAGLTFVEGTNFSATGQQVILTGGRYYQQWPQSFSFQARVTGPVTEPIKSRISYSDWDDVDSNPTNGFDTGEDDTAQIRLRVR